jgi:hypothetical protein
MQKGEEKQAGNIKTGQSGFGAEEEKREEKKEDERQQRKEGEDNRKRKQVTILRPLQSEKLHNRSRPDNWHLKGLLIPWSRILFPHLNIKYSVHGSQQITLIYIFM